MAHPELESEQRYLDRAYALLDGEAPGQSADELHHHPLIFGRVDHDGRTTYVGRRDVTDEDGRPIVVAWRSPTAEPFYQLRPGTKNQKNPHVKRIFTENERQLTTLYDDATTAARKDVEQFRDGTPRAATATLDPEQYNAITEPAEALVVTGGPGTGKTLVGLHRAAWIAHHRPDVRAAGIAVVVPPAALDETAGILDTLDATDITCTIDPRSLAATYGHIVVDDAPRLSDADLDALARACPSGSMTLICENTLDPEAAHRVRRLVPSARHVTLSTTYRLPRPIVDLATRQLTLVSNDVAPSNAGVAPVAIRDGIGAPLVRRGDTAEIAGDALRAAEAAASTGFRVGVVVPQARLEETLRLAAEAGSKVGDVRHGDVSRPVSVLTGSTAHGLEFDAVALVAPDEIVAESGHAALYLAITRCVQSLAIFHAEPLPAGMEHLDRAPAPAPTPAHTDPEPARSGADLHALIDALDEDDTVIVEALVRRLLSR